MHANLFLKNSNEKKYALNCKFLRACSGKGSRGFPFTFRLLHKVSISLSLAGRSLARISLSLHSHSVDVILKSSFSLSFRPFRSFRPLIKSTVSFSSPF